ncbi:hypothetical protein [Galactobacter valiniphilus]|uniref:hypothetical protein n=1 Tax=Galactobacter valiniphilus TaxID=2676122 RepID=UPI0037351467
MASKDSSHRSGRPPAWFLMTLGAGAASGIAWLVARYRRDRLVAEAGAVAHPHDDALPTSAAEAAEAAVTGVPADSSAGPVPGPYDSASAAERSSERAVDAAADESDGSAAGDDPATGADDAGAQGGPAA